jgi:CDGSH-type Zn-finger protein
VVIVPYQDGPYLVRGPVVLRDQDGRAITVSRRTVALCRCGKSRMRPFCDGTHHVVRFRAASGAEGPLAPGSKPPPHNGDGDAEAGGEGP